MFDDFDDDEVAIVEREWLSKEEISMAVKAYRMMKSEVDVEQLVKVYDSIRGGNR